MWVALGGMGHESNTFSPLFANIGDFKIIEGGELLEDNVARFLIGEGVEVIPTIYAWALPSGIVSKNTFLQLEDKLIKALEGADSLDGVCLFLHGAMEVEGIGDGETHLLKRVRETVGFKVVVSVSLDLYGNLNLQIADYADILTAYRTAPHVDVLETRLKAAKLLIRSVKTGIKPISTIIKPLFYYPENTLLHLLNQPPAYTVSSKKSIEDPV